MSRHCPRGPCCGGEWFPLSSHFPWLLPLALLAWTGCATPELFPRYAQVSLPPSRGNAAVQSSPVQLRVRDVRPCRDPALTEALETKVNLGLAQQGVRVRPTGLLLELSIEHVYRDIQTGFWSTGESAEIQVRCRVGPPGGETRLDKVYVGLSGMQRGSSARAQARELAFADLLDSLLNDPLLREALRNSS